jgi:hypothetical protein
MPRSRSTAIQSERTRRPFAAHLHFTRQLGCSSKQQQFFGLCALPASGCEMIAKVRRRAIVGKGAHQLGSAVAGMGPSLASGPAARNGVFDLSQT